MSRASTIKDIKAELSRLEAQKHELDEKVASLQGTLAHFESLPEDKQGKSGPQEIRDTIHDLLIEAKQPLHRTDLYKHLVALGILVNGQNPLGNMTAHMSQDARFTSVGDGKWGLSPEARDPNRITPPFSLPEGYSQEPFDDDEETRSD